MQLKDFVRNIPNYPVEGVMFRDITTVLKNKEALNEAIDKMLESVQNLEFDYILAPESRGFIFGMPMAYALKKGFVPVRKAGKLPCEVISKDYDLEYGSATIEIHKDALKKGDKVIIADDLLATGGTCKAIQQLLDEIGIEISAFCFFIELEELKGRNCLNKSEVISIVKY